MSDADITITLGPLPGTGTPPLWSFRVIHQGATIAQGSGPRLLTLSTLWQWVRLFEESSRPDAAQER